MEAETIRPIMQEIHHGINNFISSKCDGRNNGIGIRIECVDIKAIYTTGAALTIQYYFEAWINWKVDGMIYRIRHMPIGYEITDGYQAKTDLDNYLSWYFEDAVQYGTQEPTP